MAEQIASPTDETNGGGEVRGEGINQSRVEYPLQEGRTPPKHSGSDAGNGLLVMEVEGPVCVLIEATAEVHLVGWMCGALPGRVVLDCEERARERVRHPGHV
ncbi:unnamed protein product [Boreogadus saida]